MQPLKDLLVERCRKVQEVYLFLSLVTFCSFSNQMSSLIGFLTNLILLSHRRVAQSVITSNASR